MNNLYWTPHKSTRTYVTHDASICAGQHCCVHNPSKHHMADWPQIYRMDIGVTERICPHGIGHPDPDQYFPPNHPNWVHGCDGCCHTPSPDNIPQQL